jgi:tetratricopeptide (TPR) repeat protein
MAIAHTPNDQFLVHQRAKEHIGMGRYDLALPDALQVVRERPGWTEGLISLGMIEGQLGHWKEAAFHWHEALLLQPHNPHLRRDLERATVEMAPHEAAEFETLLKQRQTGDRYDSSFDGAVEMETYVENGREFSRPEGTGERLEKEKAEALARQAERAAARSKFLERAAIAATPSAAPTGASLGAVHDEGAGCANGGIQRQDGVKGCQGGSVVAVEQPVAQALALCLAGGHQSVAGGAGGWQCGGGRHSALQASPEKVVASLELFPPF